MADQLYTTAATALGTGAINLTSDTIKIVACTSGYSANMTSDQYLSDITSGARKATATLSSKTFSGGVFDAADPTFTSVTGGSTITQLVIYKDTGSEATSQLIWRITSYAGLPIATDGTNITVAFPGDGNKIFKVA
jgi:hypothetical protein